MSCQVLLSCCFFRIRMHLTNFELASESFVMGSSYTSFWIWRPLISYKTRWVQAIFFGCLWPPLSFAISFPLISSLHAAGKLPLELRKAVKMHVMLKLICFVDRRGPHGVCALSYSRLLLFFADRLLNFLVSYLAICVAPDRLLSFASLNVVHFD